LSQGTKLIDKSGVKNQGFFMATVKRDLLEGTRSSRDMLGLKEMDRIIIVGDISSTSFEAKELEAVSAAGLMPGDPHPNVDYIYLQNIEAQSLSNDVMKLVCQYSRITYSLERFDDDAIEVGASLVSQELSLDKDGNEMTVQYKYPVGYQANPQDTPLIATDYAVLNYDIQPVFTTKMIPQLVWSKNKIEHVSPEDEAAEYVGFVNSSSWRGYPARTWLCTRISGRSTDKGRHYNTIKEFQYNPDMWDLTATYIRSNGKAVPSPDADARKTFKIYGEKNFNSISL
jgi:hypothetical protein